MIKSPVVYNFFVRPEISKIVFEQIRKAKPNILFLVSDGPRSKDENKIILSHRKQIEDMIDWDCKVNKLYFENNIGVDKIMISTYEGVFKNYDRMIFLEEDILPDLSFFGFCDQILEKYKDDESIYLIGGMNFLEEYPKNENPSYFFVNTTSTWGMAIWRRTFETMQRDLSILDDDYLMIAIKENFKYKRKENHYKHLIFKKKYPKSLYPDYEFWLMGFNQNILYNSLAIVPSKNLVLNIGDTSNSENSDDIKLYPKRMRKIANMKLYNMDLNLTHPKFKVVDFNYNKILSRKNVNSVLRSIDKIERAMRILIFGGPKYFVIKLKKRYHKYRNYDRFTRKIK